MCFHGKCSEISVLKIDSLAFATVFCHRTCLKYAVPNIRGIPSECIWDCLNVLRVVHTWMECIRQIRLNCLYNVTLKRKTKIHVVKAVAVIYSGVKATRKQVKFNSSWESIFSRRYGWVGAVKADVKGTPHGCCHALKLLWCLFFFIVCSVHLWMWSLVFKSSTKSLRLNHWNSTKALGRCCLRWYSVVCVFVNISRHSRTTEV